MSNHQRNRTDKAAKLFANNVETTAPASVEAKQNLRKLEKLIFREMKIWWDQTTLKSYIERKMVPRGLRLKKSTTFPYPPEFQIKWDDILSKCSMELMTLIIQQEELQLADIQKDITSLQESTSKIISEQDFDDWNKNINIKLEETEDYIINVKESKLKRDQEDYDNHKVYTWFKDKYHRTPSRPILKNRNRKFSQKRNVNFSDLETSCDAATTSAYSDALDSPPEQRNYPKNKKNNNYNKLPQQPKNGARGAEGSTAAPPPRYPQRFRKAKA